jgi:hypothetical protein
VSKGKQKILKEGHGGQTMYSSDKEHGQFTSRASRYLRFLDGERWREVVKIKDWKLMPPGLREEERKQRD